jgi:hypothetical protein
MQAVAVRDPQRHDQQSRPVPFQRRKNSHVHSRTKRETGKTRDVTCAANLDSRIRNHIRFKRVGAAHKVGDGVASEVRSSFADLDTVTSTFGVTISFVCRVLVNRETLWTANTAFLLAFLTGSSSDVIAWVALQNSLSRELFVKCSVRLTSSPHR